MPYEIKYDEANDCVICRMSGELRIPELLDFGANAAALLKEHDCWRLLNDMREVKKLPSVVDIYNLPRLVGESEFPQQAKRAVVFSKDEKDYQFLETVSVNRGQLLKVFDDIDDALAWLLD